MEVRWFELLTGLLGGLALFLYGLDQLARGLQGAAGDTLRLILARLTANRFLGALTGALVTAVLNSSSVTTVLVVGLVTANVMTFAQSLSLILGANVGSTFTAQIIAFDVSRFGLALVAIGFGALFFFKKARYIGAIGAIMMGLGLVFFGMGIMGEAMSPLQTYPPFLDGMERMESPLLGILVGAVFTALVQSSAATTGIAIVMAAGGLVTLPAGIALAFGANIGTCVTALLASIGKPRDAQRAAWAHIIFNVAGVLLWLGLIDFLAEIVVEISPSHPELEGAARRAAEVPRQIANAHTVFNLANTLLFLGFTGPFAALLQRLLPDRPEPPGIHPRFLDDALLETPAMALESVRLELGHLGEVVEEMLGRVGPGFASGSPAVPETIPRLESGADELHGAILSYLGRIRRQPLTDAQAARFIRLMQISTYLEGIGDLVGTELVTLEEKLQARSVHPSPETGVMLRQLYRMASDSVREAVDVIASGEPATAEIVIARKGEMKEVVDRIAARQADRLGLEDPGRTELFRLQMEIVERLKRILSLTRRIARAILGDQEGTDPETGSMK